MKPGKLDCNSVERSSSMVVTFKISFDREIKFTVQGGQDVDYVIRQHKIPQ